MPIEINPQHNLPFDLSNTRRLFDENCKIELVDELATLIFLLWKADNKLNKTEDPNNEQ